MIDAPRNGGPDHSRIYQFTDENPFSITDNGILYEITTRPWNSKIQADQEAAYKFLCVIHAKNPKFDNTESTIRPTQEKTVYPNVSINDDEITFYKSGSQNSSMEVKKNTGELLIDYVNRKYLKNSYGLLMLLSARLDNVSGASWIRETSSNSLALLNLQLGNENYFTICIGSSKSKARNDAANKIIKESSLFKWIEENYYECRI